MRRLVVAAACLLAPPAIAQTLVEPALDLQSRGEVTASLRAVVGETIVLRMPAQGGTGFGWTESGGDGADGSGAGGQGSALARLPHACPEPPGTAPGMLQHVCFEYVARAPGLRRLALYYARPRETGPPAIRYVLEVEVAARP